MNWPGWNTAASADSWSNIWFWVSIASLVLLGASEVISHRYSLRKDDLTAQEEQARNRQHDSDIANLQLLTAQATERAAQSQMELQKYKEPRNISTEQATSLRASLLPYAGTHIDVLVVGETSEITQFRIQLLEVLEKANWQVHWWTVVSGLSAHGVSVVTRTPSDTREMQAALVLALSLNAVGIPASLPQGMLPAWQAAGWNAVPGMVSGPAGWNGSHPNIRLVIGSKNLD